MVHADEIVARLEALLLNKVTNLKWFYFKLNLNEAKQISLQVSKADVDQFLADIVLDENDATSFIYLPGGNNDYPKILSLVLAFLRENPSILRKVVRRVFDSNEIPNFSDAQKGQMGIFNEKDRARRNKIYSEDMRNLFRKNPQNIVAMAEGDSWFEFPRLSLLWGLFKKDAVSDIIDHLIEEPNISVYSLAAGGDWLSNMLRSGEYIQDLPKISPNALLLSAGGNDLVGSRRIATMVRNPLLEKKRDLTAPENAHLAALLVQRMKGETNLDRKRYENGLSLLADEFFTFLNITMTQYFLLYKNLIQLEEYQNMLIVTQGYDFVIPTPRRRKGFWRSLLNRQMDTGHWLYDPLVGKGIVEDQDLRDVMYVMINEFNEMLIGLTHYSEFNNVCHIDCRGTAQDEAEDWFDEMHLSSEKFGEVARTYERCMDDFMQGKSSKKVYRVNEKVNYSNQVVTTRNGAGL